MSSNYISCQTALLRHFFNDNENVAIGIVFDMVMFMKGIYHAQHGGS
jgi:hypothetical protein